MSRGSSMLIGHAIAASLLLVGCATATDATGASKTDAKSSKAIPANYRQMVAHYITEKVDRGKVLKAQISRPGEWERWDGTFPIVCARWTAQGQFIQQNYSLGFTFQNGQIAEPFNPESSVVGGVLGAAVLNAKTCGRLPYSPFPELLKSK